MKCKIITTSRQAQDDRISIFDNAFFASEPVLDNQYDGEITVEGDDVRITYHEDSGSGMEGVDAVVAFKISEPHEVTITRSGEVNTIMLFSQGERTISVYQTPFMPFELGIYAKRVDNRILSDGVLEIFYIVEIKGALAQKTELKLEVKKYD